MRAIEELEKALKHLEKARDEPVFVRPYESGVALDYFPRLLLGQAIDNVRFLLKKLKQEKEE